MTPEYLVTLHPVPARLLPFIQQHCACSCPPLHVSRNLRRVDRFSLIIRDSDVHMDLLAIFLVKICLEIMVFQDYHGLLLHNHTCLEIL